MQERASERGRVKGGDNNKYKKRTETGFQAKKNRYSRKTDWG